MFMDRKDFKLLYEAAMQSVAPAQQPAAPAPVQQQPAAPAPAQQPAAQQPLNIQLQDNGPTAQGANGFRVYVNGYDLGACTEYNGWYTFANTQINNILGTKFTYPEVGDKSLAAMHQKQFKSEDELKQTIQKTLTDIGWLEKLPPQSRGR